MIGFDLFAGLTADLDGWHLTFVTPDGQSTFARDNVAELRPWWAVQVAKLHNTDFWIVLNRRQFISATDPATGLPINRLSSCLFQGGEVDKLTAAETKHAFETDAQTGAPLATQTDIVFADFD